MSVETITSQALTCAMTLLYPFVTVIGKFEGLVSP